MTPTQLKLYRLLGGKTLSFGCVVETAGCSDGCCSQATEIIWSDVWVDDNMKHPFLRTQKDYNNAWERRYLIEIIGHEPTLTDLHRWMNGYCEWPNNKDKDWIQSPYAIHFSHTDRNLDFKIPYDSSKSLIDQAEETLLAIINLIEKYESKYVSIWKPTEDELASLWFDEHDVSGYLEDVWFKLK